MKQIIKKLLLPMLGALIALAALTGCGGTDAEVISENISTAADQFEVNRRIVFFNIRTDAVLMTVEGRCSIETDTADQQLEITCKTGDTVYKKHFFGLQQEVSYFIEQIESVPADPYHYRVVFKPSTVIPNIEN